MKKKIILFTDLDGTLLDLTTYSFEKSKNAVKRLKDNEVTLIFCSSKTRLEQLHYQSGLNLKDPFIVENGSAVIFHESFNELPGMNKTLVLGKSSFEIREALVELRNEHPVEFRMFSEMPTGELSKITGLDETSTALAQNRDYSETIIIEEPSNNLAAIEAVLKKSNLAIKHGGRFYTVTSNRSDKGLAVKALLKKYSEFYNKVLTIGIGDSSNDLPMLKAVDMPYLVQCPDRTWLETSLPINRVNGIGPEGFSNMVSTLFKTSLFSL